MTRSKIHFDPAVRWPTTRWLLPACAALGLAGVAVWWAVPAAEAGAPPARPPGAHWAGSTSPFAPLAAGAGVTEPPGSAAATAMATAPLPATPIAGVPIPAAADPGVPIAPARSAAGSAAPPADVQAEDTEAEN